MITINDVMNAFEDLHGGEHTQVSKQELHFWLSRNATDWMFSDAYEAAGLAYEALVKQTKENGIDTTEISKAIAMLHYKKDKSQSENGVVDSDRPVAMISGTWDLERDLIDINSRLIANDLKSYMKSLTEEICEFYRDLRDEE